MCASATAEGKTADFTTTADTLAARQVSIPLDDMPPTFRDAVAITRHLGHRQREAAQMGRYYGEAAPTLFFAEAASGDDEGFFGPRDGALATPCRVPMFDGIAHLLRRKRKSSNGGAGIEQQGHAIALHCYMQKKLAHWTAFLVPKESRPLEMLHKLNSTSDDAVAPARLDAAGVGTVAADAVVYNPYLRACECLPEGRGQAPGHGRHGCRVRAPPEAPRSSQPVSCRSLAYRPASRPRLDGPWSAASSTAGRLRCGPETGWAW